MSQDIALRVVGNDRDSIDGSIEGVGRKNDLNNKLSNLQNILTIIVVVVLIQAIGLIALIVKTNKDESVSLNQSILLSENKAVSDYDILGNALLCLISLIVFDALNTHYSTHLSYYVLHKHDSPKTHNSLLNISFILCLLSQVNYTREWDTGQKEIACLLH